ncbi:MAG: ATP-grasp domain-containing protein [Thiohalocapsa sp.]
MPDISEQDTGDQDTSDQATSGLTLVGIDVRALAQSSRGLGRRITGIDCFADLDTAAACDQLIRVNRCDADALFAAAMNANDEGLNSDLIVGGGLDGRPDLLRGLASSYRIRGNCPDTISLLADPERLFGLLGRLGIAHPPVSLDHPAKPAGWLLKHPASCGGQSVFAATGGHSSRPGAYFQQAVDGRVVSVIFAADARDAVVIGYNRLLAGLVGKRCYSFAGALRWCAPPPRVQSVTSGWIDALTAGLGLRGINGIDLILPDNGAAPLFLELNARPTATLELHEWLLPGGAIRCHLDACDGRLQSLDRRLRWDTDTDTGEVIRGYRVVYARRALRVSFEQAPSHSTEVTASGRAGHWPSWCKDLPAFGADVGAGEPLCTVHAEGTNEAEVERLLADRATAIHQSFQVPSVGAA